MRVAQREGSSHVYVRVRSPDTLRGRYRPTAYPCMPRGFAPALQQAVRLAGDCGHAAERPRAATA